MEVKEGKFYSNKIKRAAHLLFFKRGKKPGAKEWELKGSLGKNYEEVINQLGDLLSELDLEVVKVEDGGSPLLGRAAPEFRYLIRLKGSLTTTEAKMCGWRIDNLAALAASIAYLISNQGKASRKGLEKFLAEKIGWWKTATLLDAFTRAGYLSEDDERVISIGWRTKAEVELKELMKRLMEA